jgi:hypothetical protein
MSPADLRLRIRDLLRSRYRIEATGPVVHSGYGTVEELLQAAGYASPEDWVEEVWAEAAARDAA